MISLVRDNRNSSFAKSTIPIVRLVKYCVQRTNDSEPGLKRKYCEKNEACEDETGKHFKPIYLLPIRIFSLTINFIYFRFKR